jgi:DNA-binding CsgD family transcriptional regulator
MVETLRRRGFLAISAVENDYLLFSLPSAVVRGELLTALTPAEARVAHLAAAGVSNASIARLRRCSANTVANQLAAVYRKLGVGGRRELAARFASSGR